MEDLLPLVERYGYWFLLGVGFSEYAGLPIVSVPLIVGAGALSAGPALHPVPVAVAAAAGGLAADLAWYGLARWRGHRLVDAACRLSSNPGRCVVGVERRVSELGARIILPSKFLPGVGNLMAPAAGFAGIDPVRFAALDAGALLLWATAYTGLGRVFSRQVSGVVEWVVRFREIALPLAVLAIAAAAAWRTWGRRHGHPRGAGDDECATGGSS